MLTLFFSIITIMSSIGNFYSAVLFIPAVIFLDYIIISTIIKSGKDENDVAIRNAPSGNEGYEYVDWNCNGKIDYWEK